MTSSREYPRSPMVGVGVVVVRGDRCLVARRGHAPSAGAWSLPGGRVEVGETLREAALRELAEECGPDLRVEIQGVAFVVDRISRDAAGRVRYHFVLVDFVAEDLSGEPRAGTDAHDVRWATPAELETMPTTANLASLVGEVLRRRAAGVLWQGLPIEETG